MYHAGNAASQGFLFMEVLELLAHLGMTIVTTFLPRCALHVFSQGKQTYKNLGERTDGLHCSCSAKACGRAERQQICLHLVLIYTAEDLKTPVSHILQGCICRSKQRLSV